MVNQVFRFYHLLSTSVPLSMDVRHRYLLAVARLSNRDQIVSELSAAGHAHEYHTLIHY